MTMIVLGVAPPPPPLELDGELEYKVEDVIDSRITRRNLEYLVDWKSYSESEWELAENAQNAAELVHEFHARCKISKQASAPSRASRRRGV